MFSLIHYAQVLRRNIKNIVFRPTPTIQNTFFTTFNAMPSDTFQTKMTSPDFYKEAKSIHEFTAADSYGNDISLDKYKGNVVLIVNIASNCGLTKNNYAKLMDLKKKYYDSGKLSAIPLACFTFLTKNKNFYRPKQVSVSYRSHAINSPIRCPKKMVKQWYAI